MASAQVSSMSQPMSVSRMTGIFLGLLSVIVLSLSHVEILGMEIILVVRRLFF